MICLFVDKMRIPQCLLGGVSLLVAMATGQAEPVHFEKQIWPFLKDSCVECHRAPYVENGKTKKPKAGLRLDGAWAIMLGSEDGAVVEPGKANESSLYTRVMLPADDDDVMPPDGKADALTEEQKLLLKQWIDEGAVFGGWKGSIEGKPKEISDSGGKMPVSEIQEVYGKLAKGLKPVAEGDWKAITDKGGHVTPLAEGSPLLAIDFRHSDREVDDGSLAGLAAVGGHVAVLDLSGTNVTDAALKEVAKLERLVKLDLHETPVGDAGVRHLSGLKHLRYLNLYGTQVGDAAVEAIAGIGGLKRIYLWGSKVSAKGVESLRKNLPEAKVSWK